MKCCSTHLFGRLVDRLYGCLVGHLLQICECVRPYKCECSISQIYCMFVQTLNLIELFVPYTHHIGHWAICAVEVCVYVCGNKSINCGSIELCDQ